MPSYCIGYRDQTPYAEIQLGDDITVGAWGSSLLSAFSNAAKLARSVASDPVLSSVLPPPVGPALKAAVALADSAEKGQLAELLPRLRGPGARRLARRLAELRAANRKRDFRDSSRGRYVVRDQRGA